MKINLAEIKKMYPLNTQELHPYECWFCQGRMTDTECSRTEEENYEEYKKTYK